MPVDLHIHSVASDGVHTAPEILTRAAALPLKAIALTDHDSVGSVEEALRLADGYGVEVIPALELSSHIGARDVHFLGYWIDYRNPQLENHLRGLRSARAHRAREILARLGQVGIELPFEELIEVAGDGSVGRAHIAQLLTMKGYTRSVAEAFDRLLQRGACCYVDKEVMSPDSVIGMIRGIGGLAVLAHPGISRVDEHLAYLIACGLQGIEAFHADHSLEQVHDYLEIAKRNDMFVTGGSDFHGESVRGLGVGAVHVPDCVLDRMEEYRRPRNSDSDGYM